MTSRKIRQSFWSLLLMYCTAGTIFAETVNDPCGGASVLLNIVDRPTVGDSACVVPFKKAVLELGYQYQKLTPSTDYQQNVPEAEFRIGIPGSNELVLLLPNYIHQSMTPYSGLSATTIGIKHQIGYKNPLLATVESLLTLPNGSNAFGNHGIGVALNGIVNYTYNPSVSVSFMLGVSTQTQSIFNGGQRFTSINPDIVLTYVLNQKINFYGEAYGQTKTGPGEGSGFNVDGGILYLPLPNLEVDLEIGQRLDGNLGGFSHYVGAGMGLLF